jgi:hypothetical protein
MNPGVKAVPKQILQSKYPLGLSLGMDDLSAQFGVLVYGRGYQEQGGSHLGIDSAMLTSVVLRSLEIPVPIL